MQEETAAEGSGGGMSCSISGARGISLPDWKKDQFAFFHDTKYELQFNSRG